VGDAANISVIWKMTIRTLNFYLRYQLLDLLHGHTSISDQIGGTSGGQKTDSLLAKTFGKIQQSSLVVDGQDRYEEKYALELKLIVQGVVCK
jgi:hypothetical protein